MGPPVAELCHGPISRARVQLIVICAMAVQRVHSTPDIGGASFGECTPCGAGNFRTKMLPCPSSCKSCSPGRTKRLLPEFPATCAPQASIRHCRTQSTALHAPQGGSVTRLSRLPTQATARHVQMANTTMCRARKRASFAKLAQRVTSGVFAMRATPEIAFLVL